jgi:hypothetical protein
MMRGMRGRTAVVLLGALVVGTLDLAFAILFWLGRITPVQIMQSIARGIVGRETYDGCAATALLGVACHFTIAIGMTLAYYLVSRRVAALVRHPWPLGAIYGVLLYLAMSFIVLPLSAAGRPSFANHAWVASSLAMHVVFGLVIAHTARLASRV